MDDVWRLSVLAVFKNDFPNQFNGPLKLEPRGGDRSYSNHIPYFRSIHSFLPSSNLWGDMIE